jgi:hypothetical protein
MRISNIVTSVMPAPTSQVPEPKERSGRPDRDHDADDKAVSTRQVAPKGPGAIVNAEA